LRSLTTAADHARRSAGTLIDSLLEDAKKLLMLPFSTLFEVFPKLVRDLSRDQGKQVELVIQGSEVEIDKRILEEMKDPLIHLLRNCVDHGIEGSEARKTAGKPAHGMVSISVSQVDGNKVEIRVADDGAGINRRRVFEAAAKLGISGHRIGSDGSERNALDLIFLPEVSTTPIITEISGRGIGLSIVQEKVERLGGQVLVESTEGVGTTFRMLLPLTLATFRGILVHAADQVFVVPTSSVERVVRVQPQQIRTFESRKAIEVDGKAVSLARLADVLELPARPASGGTDGAFVQVIVVSAGDQRIGFSVDAVLNEQEVLVKRLGKPLLRVRNIAGATVLGSGKPVAILNPADLVKSAIRQGGRSASASAASEKIAPGKAKRKSILVAEDSITARTLLKSILESSGYEVKTAVDGAEALTILKTTDFDAVISDVEMPRLNGFDLTSRIRADKRLAQLPVVLVTALASPEDRERGVDAGANAYIVKSSFDQSNLLEVIARLT
jgi:two-component system chemotaxis sensor kinase CheA